MYIKHAIKPLAVMTLAGLVNACGGGSSGSDPRPVLPPVVQQEYDVSVVNLTNNQPLSPVALVAHSGDFRVFAIGSPASAGLEVLAEDGANGDFIAAARADAGVVATNSGTGPIGPGGSEVLSIVVPQNEATSLSISVATMLVNTNDAFTGINRVDITALAVGESQTIRSIAYDAGTEADSEAAGTIPGPAVGGEGFNAARDDDADRVSMHPGVISNQDGLATSVLTSQERFDNPVVQISITRTL